MSDVLVIARDFDIIISLGLKRTSMHYFLCKAEKSVLGGAI